MTDNNQEKTPPTEEEIRQYEERKKAYEKEMTRIYNEDLPFLKLEDEYQGLRANIAESRVRRIAAEMQLAQLTAKAAPEKKPIITS